MLQTPISYYGGKQNLLPHILPMIPRHKTYVEGFVGGGAVFWAKEPAKVEVINDYDGFIANFYKVVQTQFDELAERVQASLYCEYTYEEALKVYKGEIEADSVDKAWALWYLSRASFSRKLGAGFAFSRDNFEGKALYNFKQRVMDVKGRLERTYIFNRDAVTIPKSFDGPTTFWYFDPPYFNSNMGHYDGYTEEDFVNLMLFASTLKGKFMLSSYPSDVLRDMVSDYKWHYKEIKQPLSVTNRGDNAKYAKYKVEAITTNYNPANVGGQLTMF